MNKHPRRKTGLRGQARLLQCRRFMTPQRISEQLLNHLDVLIHAVQDDPVLADGLRRERERLLAHLQRTVEPWLQRLERISARSAQQSSRCRNGLGRRALKRWRINSAQHWHNRRRICSSLREACYLALAAEVIDSHTFDRLRLLGQRAGRPGGPTASLAQASSSSPSPSIGPGSGNTPSGTRLSGTSLGSVGLGGSSAGRPSRTYRSNVSTMRAWA